MSLMSVKVSSKTSKEGQEYWEGTATLPGFKPTKLARPDGTTQFASRSAVCSAARKRAEQLNFEGVDLGQEAEKKPVAVKKAAKKSATSKPQVAASTVDSN